MTVTSIDTTYLEDLYNEEDVPCQLLNCTNPARPAEYKMVWEPCCQVWSRLVCTPCLISFQRYIPLLGLVLVGSCPDCGQWNLVKSVIPV